MKFEQFIKSRHPKVIVINHFLKALYPNVLEKRQVNFSERG